MKKPNPPADRQSGREEDAARSASGLSRRAFLGRGAAASVAGWAGVRAASAAATPDGENPWRYDVDRLRRVDPALVHYERLIEFPVGQPSPRRLAVRADGQLAVAVGKNVLVFGPDGGRSGSFAVAEAGSGGVRALAAGADGRLWLATRDRVVVLDERGRATGFGPAFAGKPFLTGVAPAGDEVFVADSGNRVVYRCDANGRVRLRLGEKNQERKIPGLVLPSPFLDVEVGADGRLWINNPGRHRVETYTPDGELAASWGRPGVGISSFCGCCNPISLALLPDGRCVTAEKGLPRVKVYSADGRLESVVAVPDQFAPVASEDRDPSLPETITDGLDVAVDRDGRIWVLDLVGATIQGFRRTAGGRAV